MPAALAEAQERYAQFGADASALVGQGETTMNAVANLSAGSGILQRIFEAHEPRVYRDVVLQVHQFTEETHALMSQHQKYGFH